MWVYVSSTSFLVIASLFLTYSILPWSPNSVNSKIFSLLWGFVSLLVDSSTFFLYLWESFWYCRLVIKPLRLKCWIYFTLYIQGEYSLWKSQFVGIHRQNFNFMQLKLFSFSFHSNSILPWKRSRGFFTNQLLPCSERN